MSSKDANVRIDAAALADGLGRGEEVTVIDVRTPAEFETVHIPGSYNVPLDVLTRHAGEVAARLTGRVVLVCRSGVRAGQACPHLLGAGPGDPRVLEGGIDAYAAAGGRVVRGRTRWALERQVRLVAGGVVGLSLLAGRRRPAARLAAAGVATGLVVSALTDTCAMGRLLAALPRNREGRGPCAAELLDRLPGRPEAA
ncbi:sulfurtransferase [Streptosporangium violaceochromogenes]|nr:sulfurtransferase [Streptosporangium violaceochromogenes]